MSKWFTTQRISAVLGLLMVITVAVGMILPGVQATIDSRQSATVSTLATPTVALVTFPTPAPGTPVVDMAGVYTHPNAVFQLLQPQGWSPMPELQDTVASVSMVNSPLYSVIHAYAQKYTFAQDASTLDAAYDANTLAASWAEYDSWQQTARDQVEGRLVIDFTLTLGGQTYLARQLAWASPDDNIWALVLRLVVPGNNPALLERLQSLLVPSLRLLSDSLSAPLNWPAYLDGVWNLVLKYPESWSVTDGGPGRTATLSDPDGQIVLTLSSEAESVIADADAARAWIERVRPGAEILDVQPVERAYGAGFAVAYLYSDSDGEPRSGLAILLNGPGDRLATAILRLNEGHLNLLDPAVSAAYPEALQAMQTFALLPGTGTE